MELTNENLQEWKAELNALAKPHFGYNFADCLTDEDWLQERLGDTPEEVVTDNLLADY